LTVSKTTTTAKATTKAPAAEPKSATGTTQVVAQADVGFGNNLTIRGEGAGLKWNTGAAMEYNNGAWSWQTTSKDNFEFKVLLNDEVWQQGENLHAKAGTKVVFKPVF
jgi:hypothetical protein